jgi:hypothetical protein
MAVSSWGINSPSSALACRNQAGSDIFTDGPQIQPARRPVEGENGTTKREKGNQPIFKDESYRLSTMSIS